jgi:hypothetical protein
MAGTLAGGGPGRLPTGRRDAACVNSGHEKALRRWEGVGCGDEQERQLGVG